MADASRFDAVMAEAAQGDALASSSPLASSPNLLVSLREAQSQHGLRHGDFTRYRCAALHTHTARCAAHAHALTHNSPVLRVYRKYCANRLHRLHRALGFTHAGAKGRFQPRVLTALDVTDPRCVFGGAFWRAHTLWINPMGTRQVPPRSHAPLVSDTSSCRL